MKRHKSNGFDGRIPTVLLGLLAACSGSQAASSGGLSRTSGALARGPDGLPVDAREMDDRVERWRRLSLRALRVESRCVSGALEVYLPATTVEWARSVRMRLVTPRELAFHLEVHPVVPNRPYVSGVVFGMEAARHQELLARQSACVAQPLAAASPASPAPAAPPSPPPLARAPAAHPPRAHTPPPAPPATPPAPAPAPAVLALSASAEAPLHGFVERPAAPLQLGVNGLLYRQEFLLEREYVRFPMNDLNRNTAPTPLLEGALVLRLWTQEPMDFGGVELEVEDLVLEPVLPREEYARLIARRRAASEAASAEFTALCRAHPEHERCYFTPQNQRRLVTASRPPPPPRAEQRPPSPGPDHLWVAGAWQWNGTDYVWLQGLYRYVPPPVVATAAGQQPPPAPAAPAPRPPPVIAPPAAPPVAPSAASASAVLLPTGTPPPPPLRNEAPPPAPEEGSHWIQGFWTWENNAWAWTPGRWQRPPQAGVRWAPPTLQVGAGGVQLFLPGGWLQLGE